MYTQCYEPVMRSEFSDAEPEQEREPEMNKLKKGPLWDYLDYNSPISR